VTNTAGSTSPWFEFSNDQTGSYTFALITSTPGATVTLEQLLTGGGATVMQQVTGSSNALTLNTGTLTAGATYRFLYTFNAGSGGGTVSGNASFLQSPVPEPATWAMMLIGFGGMGVAMRRRRRPVLAQVA
jgi:PEP-CTERM motif-containing protein